MKVFIEKSALPFKLTQEILTKYPHAQIINNYEDLSCNSEENKDTITQGKRTLFILHYKGSFVKACPGTKNYICCGYQIFHIGEGCPLDCSYCILQMYLNRPGLKVWGNLWEEGLSELESFLKVSKRLNKVIRIGTGEFTDSLALEEITHISEKLIYFWKEINPLAILELKTKVALREAFFQKIPSDPRIIFAWSVNTDRIIEKEEKGTAPFSLRLESAKRAVKYGFSVAFHFDPIILYDEAYIEYPRVLEMILQNIPHERIAWISFGTLRFPKSLKDIAQKRFPTTQIFSEEFIEGLDLKKRYFIEVRKKLYRAFIDIIAETKDKVAYYYCMESERIWEEVLGEKNFQSEDLAKKLDKVALKLCSSSSSY
ncbi:MAG: radical SAM protein [Caldimicrobium sp.]